MKKTVLLLVLAILSLNLIASSLHYSQVPLNALPTFTGSLDDPHVKVVYYDETDTYAVVEYEGVFYVFYL